jgi:hypothetical protein
LDEMQIKLFLSRAWLSTILTDLHTERTGLFKRAKKRRVSQAVETSCYWILIWLAVVTNKRVHPMFTSLVWPPPSNIVMVLPFRKLSGMPRFDMLGIQRSSNLNYIYTVIDIRNRESRADGSAPPDKLPPPAILLFGADSIS